MIEISLIFVITFLLVLSFYPTSVELNNQKLYQNNFFLLVVFLNFCLFLSFFQPGLNISFLILILIFIGNLINISKIKKNNLTIIFLILLTFALSITLSVEIELGWDGQAIWYPKAYNFYNLGSFFGLNNYIYLEYPHLGSYIWALFWKYSIIEKEYMGRIFFIFFYVYSLNLIILKNEKKNIINFISFFLIFLLTFNLELFKGYQEYLLFSFFSIFVYVFYNSKDVKFIFLLTLLLINLSIWTKNEGIIFSIPMLVIPLLYSGKKYIEYKIIFLIIAITLYLFRIYMTSLIGDFSFQGEGFSFQQILNESFNFSSFFYDIYLITYYYILAIFKNPVWILILIFLLIFRYKFKTDNFYRTHLLMFIFFSLLVYFIFHITETKILNWHLSTALDRLMFSISGYFVFFLHKNIIDFSKKIN
mgnify:CR=1 FL=1|tara:strand:+ start:6020 stop:7276 length:1257 start_codon:yes stop_codon:yes gene_type:complete